MIGKPLRLWASGADPGVGESLTDEAPILTLRTLVGTTVQIQDGAGNTPAHDPRLWTSTGHQWGVYGVDDLAKVSDFLGFPASYLALEAEQLAASDPSRFLIWRVARSPQESLYGVVRFHLKSPGYEPESHSLGLLPLLFEDVETLALKEDPTVRWGSLKIEFQARVFEDDVHHTGARSPMEVFLRPLDGGSTLSALVPDPRQGLELVGVPTGPYGVLIGFGSSGPKPHGGRTYTVDVTRGGAQVVLDLDPLGSLNLTGCDAVAADEEGWRHVRVAMNGAVIRQDRFRGDSVTLEPVPAGELEVTVGPALWGSQELEAALRVDVPASQSVAAAF